MVYGHIISYNFYLSQTHYSYSDFLKCILKYKTLSYLADYKKKGRGLDLAPGPQFAGPCSNLLVSTLAAH